MRCQETLVSAQPERTFLVLVAIWFSSLFLPLRALASLGKHRKRALKRKTDSRTKGRFLHSRAGDFSCLPSSRQRNAFRNHSSVRERPQGNFFMFSLPHVPPFIIMERNSTGKSKSTSKFMMIFSVPFFWWISFLSVAWCGVVSWHVQRENVRRGVGTKTKKKNPSRLRLEINPIRIRFHFFLHLAMATKFHQGRKFTL